jgi:hypothetical protein
MSANFDSLPHSPTTALEKQPQGKALRYLPETTHKKRAGSFSQAQSQKFLEKLACE